MRPAEPGLIVLELNCSAARLPKVTNEPIVEEHPERRMAFPPRHQNRSSMSEAAPLERGTIRNSSFKVARTLRMLSSFAPALPASISEMVAWRKPALSLSSPWLRPICFRARRTRLPSCFGVRARSIIACLYARSYRKAIYGVEYIPQISAVAYKSNLYAEAHKGHHSSSSKDVWRAILQTRPDR